MMQCERRDGEVEVGVGHPLERGGVWFIYV